MDFDFIEYIRIVESIATTLWLTGALSARLVHEELPAKHIFCMYCGKTAFSVDDDYCSKECRELDKD